MENIRGINHVCGVPLCIEVPFQANYLSNDSLHTKNRAIVKQVFVPVLHVTPEGYDLSVSHPSTWNRYLFLSSASHPMPLLCLPVSHTRRFVNSLAPAMNPE